MDLNKVKERIRKLLAIADDDASAVDGEVTAAMALAQAALDKYHLDRTDVESVTIDAPGHIEESYGSSDSPAYGARLTHWEKSLYVAVKHLVGSVNAYCTIGEKAVGTFKTPKRGHVLRWYGPAEDAAIASDLFGEWSHVIATMAIGRYGGFARNDGAHYAMGFASALLDKTRRIAEDRRALVTASTSAIVHCAGGSLADVLSDKQRKADSWLKGQGVFLNRNRKYRAPIMRGNDSYSAYTSGVADGQRADFIATRKKKLN